MQGARFTDVQKPSLLNLPAALFRRDTPGGRSVCWKKNPGLS